MGNINNIGISIATLARILAVVPFRQLRRAREVEAKKLAHFPPIWGVLETVLLVKSQYDIVLTTLI